MGLKPAFVKFRAAVLTVVIVAIAALPIYALSQIYVRHCRSFDATFFNPRFRRSVATCSSLHPTRFASLLRLRPCK